MGPFPRGDGGRYVVVTWAAVLLLLVAACHRSPPPPPAATGQQVAEAFLQQVRQGQLDAAWQSTTAEFKSYQGRDAFRQQVAQHPWLKQPLQFAAYEVNELNGLVRGQCVYRATSSKAAGRQVRIVVAQEAGQWKVDGLLLE